MSDDMISWGMGGLFLFNALMWWIKRPYSVHRSPGCIPTSRFLTMIHLLIGQKVDLLVVSDRCAWLGKRGCMRPPILHTNAVRA